ncbi:MAG: methyltransferase [Alphaproteobacteria bacterium]|nr:methyltransferase [Alphaproteobacteria bacterium]MCB9696592.1 methyltransferase [Alphaproteobacteria bacterium]
MIDWRLDRPAPGVVVAQPARGFRYAADAFWLAGFALDGGPARTALDLGTGSGIVALLLASTGLDVLGVDVRQEWAEGWERTLAASEVAGRVRLERRDLLDLVAGEGWDLVVANPPYFRAEDGPSSPDPFKAAARTEGSATLADVVRVSLGALRPSGTAALVVPIERAPEVEAEVVACGGALLEWVDVGRRRSLLRLSASAGGDAVRRSLTETDPVVLGWYDRFGAGRPGGSR